MDAVNYRLSAEFFSFSAQYDMSGNRLFNFLQKNLQIVVNSEHFNEIVNNLAFGWSTDEQLNKVYNFFYKKNYKILVTKLRLARHYFNK